MIFIPLNDTIKITIAQHQLRNKKISISQLAKLIEQVTYTTVFRHISDLEYVNEIKKEKSTKEVYLTLIDDPSKYMHEIRLRLLHEVSDLISEPVPIPSSNPKKTTSSNNNS